MPPPSFLPLLGEGVRHAIAKRAAWNQQQRRLLALVINMMRRVTGFIFWREREIADIREATYRFRLVERQHVERRVAFHQRFHIVFQQRPDHDTGAVLLNLSKHLIQRLGRGIVDF
ncbi:Uncharacterised protein [Salmonella enterica subsp. enterica]|uniref:Uncharacterized protein n=1 Tax=Salmonella enterica I TaxID=59201 RepID=A0A447TUY7_SALET|nr:Uncharacterised protein [Salmonella enterica subsp. enterica]